MRIVLPLPPKDCKPNTHKHWRVKGKAISTYRQEAKSAAIAARAMAGQTKDLGKTTSFEKVSITATFYCGPSPVQDPTDRYRPLDSTNAAGALKAAIDGLVDAGIVGDDNHRSLRLMPPVLLRRKAEHEGKAQVVLEVEPWL